ncbi:uncharacterized protein LOC114921865 [Xyrichtys novacula]|uniref:Uncharacterized protein LOC114921865 n=1 Tax=Xyrichtys novacula TaxID=13765 RepID=A0AAV1EI11_XYRNO|nr:uncharacterized protein LOC114921865 [Xyrichtys novacula]
MWALMLMMFLLDQNQAAPLPWEQLSLQPIGQLQDQTRPSPSARPATARPRTFSSSSSSSSASSESSQSSEGVQPLRDRRKLENTAVEQVDSSQESLELPSSPSSSLWLSELVLLGQRAHERGGERSTGDDSAGSAESRQRAMTLTFHPLMTRPRLDGGLPDLTPAEAASSLGAGTGEGGGAVIDEDEGGVANAEEGGVGGGAEFDSFRRPFGDSVERGGLTFDSPGHTHHNGFYGNEGELELRL